eukprot:m.922456 g.922456  ORF g.922456 m.922456 type:complete len:403 (-) comp99089_c0_seq1:160-1368(-)
MEVDPPPCENSPFARIADQGLLIKEKLFVAVNGSSSPEPLGSFNLLAHLNAFLSEGTSRVLLLAGRSCSGKSSCVKMLALERLRKWSLSSESSRFCLLISLTGVDRGCARIVDNFLAQKGFSETDIQYFNENTPCDLILDGYDEMSGSLEPLNLLETNQIFDWPKGNLIVSCRTHVLDGFKNRRAIFAPLHSTLHSFEQVHTMPFSDEQKGVFLTKFCQSFSAEPPWTYSQYRDHILRIPDLSELIETPFFLRILVEILPRIVISQDLTPPGYDAVIKGKLYEAFIQVWFARQQGKLMRAGKIKDVRTTESQLRKYAEQLAQQMKETQTFHVRYPAPSGSGASSVWDKFFGSSDPSVVRYRYACPLKMVKSSDGLSTTYSFLHDSLAEYLAYDTETGASSEA